MKEAVVQKQVEFAWNILIKQIIFKRLFPYLAFLATVKYYFYNMTPYMLDLKGENDKNHGP